MPWFNWIKQIVDSELEWRVRNYKWRKTPSQVTTAWIWFDLANASWMPPAKQWFDAEPLKATPVAQSTDKGIYHWPNVSPSQKHIRKSLTWCNSAIPLPMAMQLCDYLLYYPTIDDSETAYQEMDNTNTLPRYETGEGVQMMAITTGARTWWQTFTVTYTNSQWVSWRTSQISQQNTSSILGTITTSTRIATNLSSGWPFIGLQSWDTWVRSVEWVQMNGVDTGFMTIVLVKPLIETFVREITAPVEIDHLLHTSQLPRVYDDAFLWYLCLPNGSVAGTVIEWQVKFIWN